MSRSIIILLCSFLLSTSSASAFNLTNILSRYPDYSNFNDLLSKTGLASEINTKQTITVLAFPNGAIGDLTSKPDDVVKMILTTHVVLDYYDTMKLENMKDKTTKLTTMFQESGKAVNDQGFLNVIAKDNTLVFGSAVRGAQLNSRLDKSVMNQPYNISILGISQPIVTPGLDAPLPPVSAPPQPKTDSPKSSPLPPISGPPQPKTDSPKSSPLPPVSGPPQPKTDSPKSSPLPPVSASPQPKTDSPKSSPLTPVSTPPQPKADSNKSSPLAPASVPPQPKADSPKNSPLAPASVPPQPKADSNKSSPLAPASVPPQPKADSPKNSSPAAESPDDEAESPAPSKNADSPSTDSPPPDAQAPSPSSSSSGKLKVSFGLFVVLASMIAA